MNLILWTSVYAIYRYFSKSLIYDDWKILLILYWYHIQKYLKLKSKVMKSVVNRIYLFTWYADIEIKCIAKSTKSGRNVRYFLHFPKYLFIDIKRRGRNYMYLKYLFLKDKLWCIETAMYDSLFYLQWKWKIFSKGLYYRFESNKVSIAYSCWIKKHLILKTCSVKSLQL